MRLPLFALGLLLATGLVFAQPRIDLVQNNYSYLLPDNPNYGIAQGSIVLITGRDLASSSSTLQSIPLKTILNGVSGQVTVNGVSKLLILYYVTPTAIGAIIPSSTPVGTGTISVFTGEAGTSKPITIVPSAFGALTQDGSGTGRALATDANFNVLTNEHPAKPGDTIVFFGTGLGAVVGNETTTQVQGNLPIAIAGALVGGLSSSVAYAGRTIYPGLDQVNITLPTGLPIAGAPFVPPGLKGNQFGCNVTVVFMGKSSDLLRSNTVTIPVSANGEPCVDPLIPSGGAIDLTVSQTEANGWLSAGQLRRGNIGMSRNIIYSRNPLTAEMGVRGNDSLSAGFLQYSGADVSKMINSAVTPAVPVPGTCSVTFSDASSAPQSLTLKSLDSGDSVGVSSANGLRVAPPRLGTLIIGDVSSPSITYSADIGSTAPNDYLDAGRYTFFSQGGPDVGAFSGSIDFPGFDLKWINRTSVQSVTRANGLTINWLGGGDPTDILTITGNSTRAAPADTIVSSSSFTCYASVRAGTFTVPASITSQLYATQLQPNFEAPTGGGVSISISKKIRMQATGLDYLLATISDSIAQSTEWK